MPNFYLNFGLYHLCENNRHIQQLRSFGLGFRTHRDNLFTNNINIMALFLLQHSNYLINGPNKAKHNSFSVSCPQSNVAHYKYCISYFKSTRMAIW